MTFEQTNDVVAAEWGAALDRHLRQSGYSVSVSIASSTAIARELRRNNEWEWVGIGEGVSALHVGAPKETWNDLSPAAIRAAWNDFTKQFGGAGDADVVSSGSPRPELIEDGNFRLIEMAAGVQDGIAFRFVSALSAEFVGIARKCLENPFSRLGLDGLRFSLHSTLGKTNLQLSDVLRLTPGSMINLSTAVSDPVDVHVNGRLFGRAKVALCGLDYGLQYFAEKKQTEKAER